MKKAQRVIMLVSLLLAVAAIIEVKAQIAQKSIVASIVEPGTKPGG